MDNQPGPEFPGQYVILKHVLEHLNISDLLKASQVCKAWNEVGRIVRKQREGKLLLLMFYHPYLPYTEETLENQLPGLHISKRLSDLIVAAGYPSPFELLADKKKQRDVVTVMQNEIRKKLISSYDEIQLFIILGTNTVSKLFRKFEKKGEIACALGNISNFVPCILSSGYGLIATTADGKKTYEVEDTELPIMNGIGIPKIKDFHVRKFQVVPENKKKLEAADLLSAKRLLNIVDCDEVKGIIIFNTDSRWPVTRVLIASLSAIVKNDPRVAIGGGTFQNSATAEYPEVKRNRHQGFASGFAICGKRAHVASIALTDPKISDKNAAKIIALSKHLKGSSSSFAFMFACCGRGTRMHNYPHVEATLFRQHFPHTPLFGSFTNGELCWENIAYIADNDDHSDIFPKSRKQDIDHTYTTVFVLVAVL